VGEKPTTETSKSAWLIGWAGVGSFMSGGSALA